VIREATNEDHEAVWKIFHEVVARGDTYTIDPNISRDGTEILVRRRKPRLRRGTRSTRSRHLHPAR